MPMRVILLVAAALLFGGGAILMAKNMMRAPEPQVAAAPQKPVHETFVAVAGRNLPAGTLVQERDFRWQAWPDETLADSYLVKGEFDLTELTGGVVRQGIIEGDPIAQVRIIKPGERGFLSALLRPGYRAKSIKIGAASGVAGLISPGDRIDLVLSHTIKGDDKKRRRASETVLENVRILAIDQRLDDQQKQSKVGKTITLELTPKQVEIVTVADSLGSLSVSLRSLANDKNQLERIASGELDAKELPESNPVPKRTYTWENEASLLVPWGGTAEGLTVARGSEVTKVSRNGREETVSKGSNTASSDNGEGAPEDTQSAEAPQ